ncbi:Polypeptide N-Acetylgalactosaminyltransferase 13 [Manis pentadactyla]|nr:Polypeptide N-Acetylgalactosaminyltransferase 13 [Manis pentadactyla]
MGNRLCPAHGANAGAPATAKTHLGHVFRSCLPHHWPHEMAPLLSSREAKPGKEALHLDACQSAQHARSGS